MSPKSKELEYKLLFDALLSEQYDKVEAEDKKKKTSSKVKANRMFRTLSPKQLLLAKEDYRYVSVLCPRRAGKSYAILTSAMANCVMTPGWRVAIFCRSKPHAKGVYWEDIMAMNEKFDLDLRVNATELIVRFPNGSLLVLCGAESDAEINKVRGRKYHRVVLDESTVIDRKLYSDLINYVIEPALKDLRGALWIAGTPKGDHSGEFYEATCTPPIEVKLENGRRILSNWKVGTEEPTYEYRWKLHTWTAQDNTAIPFLWEEFLETKRFRGWKDDNPLWRQEYLGEWVKLDSSSVFRIQRYVHTYEGSLPWADERLARTRFILGADFGYHDGTAIVIWAFVEDEPYVYEFISMKRHGITEQQIAEMITNTERLLPKPVQYRVGDTAGGGVLIMEGLKRTYGLHFEPAEKNDKVSHINYFNLALDSNLVRFRPGSDLMNEMELIQWEEKSWGTSRQREDPSYPNDLSDAALYAFRFAKSRFISASEIQAVKDPLEDSRLEKEEYCRNRDAMRRWRRPVYRRMDR